MNVLNFQGALLVDGNLKALPKASRLDYALRQLRYEYDADQLTPEEYNELEEWIYDNYEA